MARLIERVTFPVPANLQAWTQGITFKEGETLTHKAGGHTTWVVGMTTVHAFPEGEYIDDNTDPDHANLPDEVKDYADTGHDPDEFIVADTKPECLSLVFVEAGSPTPSVAGNLTGGYTPGRGTTTYTYEDIAADLGIVDGSDITAYYINNDLTGEFADNSGSFLVTLARYAEGVSKVSLSAMVRLQYGPLSLAALETPVAADRLMVIAAGDFNAQPQLISTTKSVAGSFGDREEIPEEEWTNFTIPINPDYREIGWLFSSLFGIPVETLVGNGSNGLPAGAYKHIWRPKRTTPNTLQPFTFQYGVENEDAADNIIFQCNRALFNALALNTKRGQGAGNVGGSAGGYARRREATDPANTFDSVEEVWTITLVGGPTSGAATFTTEDGDTFAIQFDDTAGEADTAIEAVYGVGNVVTGRTGSGSAGSPYIYTVTFGGDLVGKNIAPPTSTHNLLGGTTPSVTLVETVRGGPKEYAYTPILPADGSMWYASAWADLFAVDGSDVPTGSALMLEQYETNFNWAGIHTPTFSQNRAFNSYKGQAERDTQNGRREEIAIKNAVDAQGMAFWDNWRNRAVRYFGAQFKSGTAISGSTYFELKIAGRVKVNSTGNLGANEGIWTIDSMLGWVDAPELGGKAFEITLITDVAAFSLA